MTALVEFNASMIEFSLPPDAETLTLEALQAGDLDADALLQFRSLIDEMNAYGLAEFVVTDRDNVVLFGFDMGQIGAVLEPLADGETAARISKMDDGQRQITAAAPIRNENGDLLGSVRLQMELGEIGAFLRDLNGAIWTAGGADSGVGTDAGLVGNHAAGADDASRRCKSGWESTPAWHWRGRWAAAAAGVHCHRRHGEPGLAD